MLVELVSVPEPVGNFRVARVRTPFGRVEARWCGNPTAAPGEYHVEWTIDEDVTWGGNTESAVDRSPGIRPAGSRVTLRGRLHLTDDGAALLELGGTLVLLDVADPPPPREVDGTWIEFHIDRGHISLHPFEL